MADIKLATWIEMYKNGEFDKTSNPYENKRRMIDAGWYDWWCKDEHLNTAFAQFVPIILSIAESQRINKETMYVWFKNNLPCVGRTYDDFRFADLESGDVQYTISKLHRGCYGESFSGWELYGIDNHFKEPLVRGTLRDIKKFFGVK